MGTDVANKQVDEILFQTSDNCFDELGNLRASSYLFKVSHQKRGLTYVEDNIAGLYRCT